MSSNCYCTQLTQLLKENFDLVKNFLRSYHACAHGLHKRWATYATSCTTAPPPVPSVARFGEWSMGKILQVNWHFAEPSDCYLG